MGGLVEVVLGELGHVGAFGEELALVNPAQGSSTVGSQPRDRALLERPPECGRHTSDKGEPHNNLSDPACDGASGARSEVRIANFSRHSQQNATPSTVA